MGNCLVTKLKDSVNSSELIKLGELKLTFKDVSLNAEGFLIRSIVNQTLSIITPGAYFTDSSRAQNLGQTLNLAANTAVTFYTNTDCTISIEDKYSINTIYPTPYSVINLEDWKYCTSLHTVRTLSSGNGTKYTGDISILKNLPIQQFITETSSYFTGNISDIAALASIITSFGTDSPNIQGSLGDILTCTHLKELYLPRNVTYTTAQGNAMDAILTANGSTSRYNHIENGQTVVRKFNRGTWIEG